MYIYNFMCQQSPLTARSLPFLLEKNQWKVYLKLSHYAFCDHCNFLCSPFAYVDPLHCNMAYLYLELLKDSLNEYAYAAELAGLNYDLQNTVYGMYVSIQSLAHGSHAASQTSSPCPCSSSNWVSVELKRCEPHTVCDQIKKVCHFWHYNVWTKTPKLIDRECDMVHYCNSYLMW